MNGLYSACENAIFEALTLYPEYKPEGIEEIDVCMAGGELLAAGLFGAFVYLYGRGLALRVRERVDCWASEPWLAAMKDAIVRGFSLHDNQGSVGGISYMVPQVSS